TASPDRRERAQRSPRPTTAHGFGRHGDELVVDSRRRSAAARAAMPTLPLVCWTSFPWVQVLAAVAGGLVLCQLNLYLTTAVLHRGLTHGAILYPRWLQRSVVAWRFFTSSIPPQPWTPPPPPPPAGPDTADDPRAPSRIGFWRVLLLTWYYVPRWARANWA